MPAPSHQSAARLLAAESGTIRKDWHARLKIALVYPNTYHVGMSNLGFQTVYKLFNDFEQVVCNPYSKGYSRSSGLPAAWGHTADGRYIMAVYEELDETTILPVTAYEVPEPR